MAAVAFPIGVPQPVALEQPAQPPNQTGGQQITDPNRPDGAPQDTVTLTGTFPPAQPVQQAAFIQLQEFALFAAQANAPALTNNGGNAAAQPAAPANAQFVAENFADANVQFVQAAPAGQSANTQANAAANNGAQANAQAAAATGAAPATDLGTTPQQELQQLDSTLQDLGINPQSISLFNRLGLLLYANDPAALQNLVQTLQTVDQQLQQIGGAATNVAAQAGGAVQDLLPANANQAQQAVQTAQQNEQVVPEPLTPIQIPNAPAPAPAAQLQNQEAPNNTTTEIFAAQLSFSEFQATGQQIEQPSNTQGASNGNGAAPAQNNPATVEFQAFQLRFQAVEILQNQQASTNGNGQAQGQGVNLQV